VLKSEGGAQARDGRRVQGMRGSYGRGERKGGGVRQDSQNDLQGAQLLPELALWGTLFYCKGYCGWARHGAGCGAERGTSRGSEGFSLLCNDKLNKSAYLAGDPKRKG